MDSDEDLPVQTLVAVPPRNAAKLQTHTEEGQAQARKEERSPGVFPALLRGKRFYVAPVTVRPKRMSIFIDKIKQNGGSVILSPEDGADYFLCEKSCETHLVFKEKVRELWGKCQGPKEIKSLDWMSDILEKKTWIESEQESSDHSFCLDLDSTARVQQNAIVSCTLSVPRPCTHMQDENPNSSDSKQHPTEQSTMACALRTPNMQYGEIEYACAMSFERIDIQKAGQLKKSSTVAFVEINCNGNKKHYELLRYKHKDRVPITDGKKSWGELVHFVVVQFHSTKTRYRYAVDTYTVRKLHTIIKNHGRDGEHVGESVGSFIAKNVANQPATQPHRQLDELLIGRSDRPTKHDLGIPWDLDEWDSHDESMHEHRLAQQREAATAATTRATTRARNRSDLTKIANSALHLQSQESQSSTLTSRSNSNTTATAAAEQQEEESLSTLPPWSPARPKVLQESFDACSPRDSANGQVLSTEVGTDAPDKDDERAEGTSNKKRKMREDEDVEKDDSDDEGPGARRAEGGGCGGCGKKTASPGVSSSGGPAVSKVDSASSSMPLESTRRSFSESLSPKESEVEKRVQRAATQTKPVVSMAERKKALFEKWRV